MIGVLAGLVQGFYGGWLDLIMQRFIEIWGGLPQLYILIILASVVEPNFWWLLGSVAAVQLDRPCRRCARGNPARKELGLCARGPGTWRLQPKIMVPACAAKRHGRDHYIPAIHPAGSVTTLTALDFIGFGLPPGSASLGEMLQQGKNNLQAPWLGFTGFLSIAVLLTLLVFAGEAVRDAFDPRKTIPGAA